MGFFGGEDVVAVVGVEDVEELEDSCGEDCDDVHEVLEGFFVGGCPWFLRVGGVPEGEVEELEGVDAVSFEEVVLRLKVETGLGK